MRAALPRAVFLSMVALFVLDVSQLAGAGCVGKPVNAFGAKGDGHTDDTAAIQTAVNAAAAKGGGAVVLEVARYFTAGTLFLPNGVVLCGAVEGPFDVSGVNPATTTIAPTLLVTNRTGPFIDLGMGAGVTDVLFHYPHQVHSNASVPIPYPFTIQIHSGGRELHIRGFGWLKPSREAMNLVEPRGSLAAGDGAGAEAAVASGFRRPERALRASL